MTSSAGAVSSPAAAEAPASRAVMIGALGVVFGDIGTSPIYAFRESLRAAGNVGGNDVVLGVLSLIFWAVTLVVAIKYVVFVMRADNHGEGGTMALLSLALPAAGRFQNAVLVTGLAGAALFFGDAMITPAISVVSAVEGLSVFTPSFQAYVVPIGVVILIGLFVIQSRGSGQVGKLFGPVMLGWFGLLALMGLFHSATHPDVFRALDPRYAVSYIAHTDGWTALTVLGSVFLALTGGEALYADMGHFGRTAIRRDWFAVVMPALVLNY
jgi:KUP system potassium uptake protein